MPLLLALLLLGLPDQIDTVAGSDWVGDNGAARSAILLQAEGIAADPQGNLYIADAADHRVRKLTPAGIISTVAGTGVQGFSGDSGPAVAARLNSPYGLAFGGSGELYIADLGNARVRRVTANGIITTIAGGGDIPAGGENEGSAASVVSLNAPRNLALDNSGNLYISDFGAHRVYRMGSEGSLTTVAGTGIRGYSGDGGPAPNARLAYPAGIALDRQGALYIADSQNHVVRKVSRGVISSGTRAVTPTGLAFDQYGTLYVADPFGGQVIQAPVTGPATAMMAGARDLSFAGSVLFGTDGSVVRKISFTGPSEIMAGGGNTAHGDLGPATLARLNHPGGVAADGAGNLYIADRDNHRIRRVSADGTITTMAGELNAPSAVSIDASGNLYVADTGDRRVLKVTPGGQVLPVIGLVSASYALAGPDGNVYIAEGVKGAIYKLSPAGTLTLVLDGLQSPRGMAFDAAGNLYFTEAGGPRVWRLGTAGDLTSLGEGMWSVPRGIAVNDSGDVFVADTGLQRILRIDRLGQVTAVAGTGTAGFSGDGGPALSAELGFPWDVAMDPGGSVYIADLNNNRVRRLSPAAVTVVNAATLQSGPIAPGMLLDVRGAGSGAQVVIGGIPAPILSDSVVQAPPRIAGLQSVQIEVFQGERRIARITATVVPAAPALFADTSGQAAANNEDGSVNSAANPAVRGSVVALYGTGEGISGLPISVRIGDYPAEVLYAGPVAGYPGLLQINARVPAGYIAPGTLRVTIAVGESSSQPGVTIAVN